MARWLLAGVVAATTGCSGAQAPGTDHAARARYLVRERRGWRAGARGRLDTQLERTAHRVLRDGAHVVREETERHVVRFVADYEVSAVREGGRVDAESYTVAEFSLTDDDTTVRPLAAGARLESDCRDPAADCVLRVDGALAERDLYDALDPVIGLHQSNDDTRSAFDSETPRAVGERWPVDPDVARDTLSAGGTVTTPSRDRVRGRVALAGVRRVADSEWVELDGEIAATGVRAAQLPPNITPLDGAVRFRVHTWRPADVRVVGWDSDSHWDFDLAAEVTRPSDHARLRIDMELHTHRRSTYIPSQQTVRAAEAAPLPAVAAHPRAHLRALPRGSAVSTNYRFALRATPGWTMLAGDAAQRVVPGAAAAALDTADGLAGGFVRVEPTGEVELERLAARAGALVNLEDARETSRDRVRVAGTDAVRVRREGRRNGAAARTTEVLLLHEGFVYAIAAWCTGASDAPADAVVDAFELLPGPVTDAWQYPDIVEARGPDWRVHARRFESASSGLRVTPGPRWQFIPDPALASLRRNAEVGVTSLRPRVTVLLDGDHVAPAGHQRYLAAVAASRPVPTPGQPAGPPMSFVLAGAPLPLARVVVDGSVVLHGVRCNGATCVQVSMLYALADEAGAHALLAADMPEVDLLADAERAALARELAATPAPTRVVGDGFSLRNGRYVLPSSGVSLVLPPSGTWRVRTGAEARVDGDAVFLSATDAARGVGVVFMRDELDGPVTGAGFHAMAREIASLPAAARLTPVRLGPTTGYVSDGEGASPVGPVRMRVVTATRGHEGFRLVLVGPVDNMAAAGDLVAELAAGLTVAPATAPTPEQCGQRGDRWVDEHFGFAVRVPPGWDQTAQTEATTPTALLRTESWSHGDASLVVTALFAERGPTDTLSTLVNASDGALAGVARASDAQDVTFHGYPARRFTWRGLHRFGATIFVQIDHTAYVVRASDPQSVDAALATTERFELLP